MSPTATPFVTFTEIESDHAPQLTSIIISPLGPGVTMGEVPSLGNEITAPSGKVQFAYGMLGIQELPN